MTNKKLFFLSGLPRTGSTLLGSILSQNPEIHVTPTSPMYPLLVETNEAFNRLSLQYTYDHVATSNRVYHALVDAFYDDIKETVIFDKNRGWPKSVEAIKLFLNPDARIIATVRPIAEIITSYIVLAEKDPDNFIDAHLKALGKDITNESRANLLWSVYLKAPYDILKEGLKTHPENILLVEYNDIALSPDETLEKVYEFCGLDPFTHVWEGIKNTCAEAKDEAWGMKNLHDIRPTLGKRSVNPIVYLSQKEIDYYNSFNVEEHG